MNAKFSQGWTPVIKMMNILVPYVLKISDKGFGGCELHTWSL